MNAPEVMAEIKRAVEKQGYYVVRGEWVADGGDGFAFHVRTAPRKAVKA